MGLYFGNQADRTRSAGEEREVTEKWRDSRAKRARR